MARRPKIVFAQLALCQGPARQCAKAGGEGCCVVSKRPWAGAGRPGTQAGGGWDAQPSRPIGSLTHWLDVSSEGRGLARQGQELKGAAGMKREQTEQTEQRNNTEGKRKEAKPKTKGKPKPSQSDRTPWTCGNKEDEGRETEKHRKQQSKRRRSIQTRPGQEAGPNGPAENDKNTREIPADSAK